MVCCCSSFEKCSDLRDCIHEASENPQLKELSSKCYYHLHLHNGRVFYGKNANKGTSSSEIENTQTNIPYNLFSTAMSEADTVVVKNHKKNNNTFKEQLTLW